MKRWFYITFLVALLVLAGCQADDPATQEQGAEPLTETAATENSLDADATDGERLLVYLSGPEAMIEQLEAAFEGEHGDVVDLQLMSCGQVRSKTWMEKEAGRIEADIIWGSDPLLYNRLDDEGLLAPLACENLERIAEPYRVDHHYCLVNERYATILYNTDAFENQSLPQSYQDLTNPQFANRCVMADATQSSTALGITSALYQLAGESLEYFQALKDNGICLAKSNGQIPSLLMEGQFDLGIGPHDALIRLNKKAKKEGYTLPLKAVWPEEGVIALHRPLAIIADPERSEGEMALAQEFVNFMLSKQAQEIMTRFGFVSVRDDMENPWLPEGVKLQKIDWEKASLNEAIVREGFADVFHQ